MPHIKYPLKAPSQAVIHRTHCCGIMEIDCLGRSPTPEHALLCIQADLFRGAGDSETEPGYSHYAPKFVSFSGVVGTVAFGGSHDGGRKDDYGQKFADYLTTNNLGTIISTEAKQNWTRNYIKMWIWTPNYDTLFKHIEGLQVAQKQTVKVEEEVGG